MTIVIALKDKERIVVGSDSACGDEKTTLRCGPKFFESDGIIWGLCGFVIYEQALRRAVDEDSSFAVNVGAGNVVKRFKKILENENLLIDKDGFKEMKDSRFFFIENNKMFYLDADLSYWETHNPFLAIGSGAEFALGALHALESSVHTVAKVEAGLEAAAAFNPFVRVPFHIQEFKLSEA